jgi:hypothetical protein
MSAERHSLGGSFQDDPRSVRSIDLTEESRLPSKSSCAPPARPFILARLIPAGPATALAMPPTLHRRAVS